MNQYELFIGILIIVLRFYLIYLMYVGFLEIFKLHKIWLKLIYVAGSVFYVYFTWTTTIESDIEQPSKIVGLVALNLVLGVLVATVKFYRTNMYPDDELQLVISKYVNKILGQRKVK